jgi:hypothetical protein
MLNLMVIQASLTWMHTLTVVGLLTSTARRVVIASSPATGDNTLFGLSSDSDNVVE